MKGMKVVYSMLMGSCLISTTVLGAGQESEGKLDISGYLEPRVIVSKGNTLNANKFRINGCKQHVGT